MYIMVRVKIHHQSLHLNYNGYLIQPQAWLLAPFLVQISEELIAVQLPVTVERVHYSKDPA